MAKPSMNYLLYEIGPDGKESPEPLAIFYSEEGLIKGITRLPLGQREYKAYVATVSSKGKITSREPYTIPLEFSAVLSFRFKQA